jgi:GNAT superfamily N-acetyltransferase
MSIEPRPQALRYACYPMQILDDRLDRLLPLVPSSHDAGHMAFVHAVTEGRQSGHAFVDRADAPRSALVFNHSGFGFALGEARPDMVALRLDDLIAQASIRAQPTALWCTAPAWADALRLFVCEERSRDEFHFDRARAPTIAPLAPGYRLQPLDATRIERWGEGLDQWLVHAWGGAARYAEHAFGIAVLHRDAMVADCAACAIGGPRGEAEAEIEIGTAPTHRRKGLAIAAGVAFFEHCRARGLEPAWTCDTRNEPSRLLANVLGFTYFRSVVGFRLRRDALAARA